MSHPNPYLFQINRLVWQASSRMDISASARSYQLQDGMDYQGCIYYALDKLYSIDVVRTLMVVKDIHSKFYCYKF
jgi:hypothetical protein